MNFYNLKCFITLAEELNFTRASERLYISQPTLSKIILSLESELECTLFERNKKSVKLTMIGKQFYNDCIKINDIYTESLALCRSLKTGTKGIVKIGFVAFPMHQCMQSISNSCTIYCPEIQLQYIEDKQFALLKYLSSGKIDIALFCDWGISKLNNISTHTLYKDEYCLIVSDKHPLAECKEIEISELKNETFIVCKSPNSIQEFTFYEKADNSSVIRKLCQDAGFIPKINASAQTLMGMLMIVANNVGVSIAAKHLSGMYPGTRFIKIKNECPDFYAIMAWSDNTTNPSVLPIVNTIKDLFH